MATVDTGWDPHPKSPPWWRPKSTLGWIIAALIALLLLLLVWVGYTAMPSPPKAGVANPATAASGAVTAASAPAPAASTVQPPPVVADAPKKPSEAEKQAAAKASADATRKQKADEKAAAEKAKREKKMAAAKSAPTPNVSVAKAPLVVAAQPTVVSAAPVATPTAPQYRVKTLGRSPCKLNPDCTLDWALGQSGWPQEAREAMKMEVRSKQGDIVYIKKGERFDAMAFGRKQRRMERNVIMDWDDPKHIEPARQWRVGAVGMVNVLTVPDKCGNYSFSRYPGAPIASAPTQPSPGRMPLGVIPVVTCPDDGTD